MNLQTVTIADGVRVVVEDQTDLITSYVLREQGDWFEDEIRFVRRLLEPGECAVDVGANHGVYALSMAKAVGPQGAVWAFEPASAVAELLDCSVAVNGFAHLHVLRQALSSREGEATLFVGAHSELNTLNEEAAPSGAAGSQQETVSLTTLDACLPRWAQTGIAFLKLDAEGEEARIIQGAKRLLRTHSPLVMFELRAGAHVQMELVGAFEQLGYQAYRLVPGLGLLAPFDANEPVDDFQLNLFACKPDRAARLAARGLLVTRAALEQAQSGFGLLGPTDWLQRLRALPYGRHLADIWSSTVEAGLHAEVAQALALHAQSHEPSIGPAQKLVSLQRSLALLQTAAQEPGAHLRLASLARLAAEAGARTEACKALSQLCARLMTNGSVGPAEPFLSPSPRFDTLPPIGPLGNWLLAATLEERERLSAFSSFFSGQGSWESLKAILSLGYASDDMRRRAELVQQRFQLAAPVTA